MSIYLPSRVGLSGGFWVEVRVGWLGGLLVARVGPCTSHVLTLGLRQYNDEKTYSQT